MGSVAAKRNGRTGGVVRIRRPAGFPLCIRWPVVRLNIMKRLRLLLILTGFGVFLLGGLWLGVTLQGLTNRARPPFTSATVLRQVQTLSQLVTVKYVMEKVVMYEDVKWYPGGENRVLMIAHGIVKAGVDLQRLESGDVRLSGSTVRVRLPRAQITDCYLDENQTQVVERTTGLLRAFDKNLEQTTRKIAVDDIQRAARYAGILKDADERARAQIKEFFQLAGYTVEFVEP